MNSLNYTHHKLYTTAVSAREVHIMLLLKIFSFLVFVLLFSCWTFFIPVFVLTAAEIISHPLDVLFMVDRSSTSDVDLTGTKCLLRNLTHYFDVAYYKKVGFNAWFCLWTFMTRNFHLKSSLLCFWVPTPTPRRIFFTNFLYFLMFLIFSSLLENQLFL